MRLTNAMNLPAPFVDAATSDYKYHDKRYSATALLKGTREAILQRRHADEIEADVSDMVWAIFGSAVHSILENSQETATQLKENYVVVPMQDGYEVSGIFDLYDDATGTVTDYKTASTWKVIFGDFTDWRRQTLIYVWMLRQIGFDAHRGEIVAMLKDHSKRDAKLKAKDGYPQHPVFRIGWEFTPAELEATGEALRAKFAEIAAAEKLPDAELPMCTDEERWHKADKWAVVKGQNKRATRVLDSEEEAEALRAELEERTGTPHRVDFRPGEDSKCREYCSACEFCTHYIQNVKEAQ